MKIQYCSDLHLEFPENYSFIKRNPLKTEGDILIIAGDFYLLNHKINHIKDFISFASDNFKEVYWVPGNHEFYNSDIGKWPLSFQENISSNFFLINNKNVVKEDVQFIFSTLWTHIPEQDQWYISKHVSDFWVIKNHKKNFSPENFNALHDVSLNFIKESISSEKEKRNIIISHHVPTNYMYPDIYKGSKLNTAFSVELFDFIEASEIHSWIFGHHHINVPEFVIGKTRMLTNQLGYVHHNEHRDFNKSAVLEV